jgi:ketosteroid isomerase-like protein
MESTAIARQFVDAINTHDLDAIYSLMTDDHRFVDPLGTVARGRDSMRVGWSHYFRMVPDYTISIEHGFASESRVVYMIDPFF